MYDKLARRLFSLSLRLGVLRSEDEELYLFAFSNLLSQIASWASLLILAGLFHLVPQMVLYMVFFVPLRSYAGGYHERNYWRCFLLSVVSQLALMLFIPWLASRISPAVTLGILSAAAVVVAYLSPVPDANKPLSAGEYLRYRRLARVILGVEYLIISVVLIMNTPPEWALFMSAGPVTVAVTLLIARCGLGSKD